jgi:cell shape-determining protein MreD
MLRREGVLTLAVLLVAVAAVALQGALLWPRRWLGAQPDLLPCLMVFCGLSSPLALVSAAALLGGFCFDALSANPPGISVPPLLALGVLAHQGRGLLLRDSRTAQAALGAAACVAAPLATLLLLRALWPLLDAPGGAPAWQAERAGRLSAAPPAGWFLLRHALVAAGFGALATPLLFRLLDWIGRAFSYPEALPTAHRANREIKRGRR